MKQTSAYCAVCGRQTLHAKQGTSNTLHLILSIITVGLWIPVWIVLGMKSAGSKMRCQVCGSPQGARMGVPASPPAASPTGPGTSPPGP